MNIGRLWAGQGYGTNTGKLFVVLEGDVTALKGTLHFNEATVGIVVYDITATFDGRRLNIQGTTKTQVTGFVFGSLKAHAELVPKGELHGEWQTDTGAAGTFVLFPHDVPKADEKIGRPPEQLHSARHDTGAIEIDRQQIVDLADMIQKEFSRGRVIVTVVSGTEQSYFLDHFKTIDFTRERAELVKIFVQEPDVGGVNRTVTVEFGQLANWVMTQSSSEAWSLGKLEQLKIYVKQFERTYATRFKRLGLTFNNLLLLGAIVVLPSLSTLTDRVILMVGVLCILYSSNWLHSKYVPFSAIHLKPKAQSFVVRIISSTASWFISILAAVATALLAAYLKGSLEPFIQVK